MGWQSEARAIDDEAARERRGEVGDIIVRRLNLLTILVLLQTVVAVLALGMSVLF